MVQKNGLTKIVIIAGPTASGKTDLSLKCATKINGEIIGCDSMQIYQGLNIGTGKLSERERTGIRHFMIDIVPPNGEFSVYEFVKGCEAAIKEILSHDKVPIIVGGTGLYITGLLQGMNYCNANKSEEIRKKYNNLLEKKGKEYIFGLLEQVDKEASLKINPNDTKRVIRALEIFELTGNPKSKQATANTNCKYDYRLIVLSPPRDLLYSNINARVDKMIESGLVEEVRSLYEYRDCQSMQAIGYKEIVAYLENKIQLDEAIDLIKINSRHYAKRQITYFNNIKLNKDIYINYTPKDDDRILNEIYDFLNKGDL